MRSDVAALYVDPRGPYPKLVEHWWDEKRDARTYAGPWPVVAHPPCERWGRYWSGGPNPHAARRTLGDDGGCFEAALTAVRKWGGVLEHPEASHAWKAFGLKTPPKGGGWVPAGDYWRGDAEGWTCCVEQGHYGHRARKATWLYVARIYPLPNLRWGSSGPKPRLDDGFHSKAERAAGQKRSEAPRLSKVECVSTPAEFAWLLLDLASIAKPNFQAINADQRRAALHTRDGQ